jgi:hypothetical protein
MKTIRITLSALAIVISIGGAIASSMMAQTTVYEWIDYPGTEEDMCFPRTLTCGPSLPFLCQITGGSGAILRNSSVITTSCGFELRRSSQPQ